MSVIDTTRDRLPLNTNARSGGVVHRTPLRWSSSRWRVPASISEALDGERHRFFLWSPVCLGGGIAIYFALPTEPSEILAWMPALIAVLAFTITARGSLLRVVVTAICLAALGFGLAKSRVERMRAPVIEKPMRAAVITGVVRMAEARVTRGQRITLDVTAIAGLDGDVTPKRVRIRSLQAETPVTPGDRIRITASIAPPSKPALPGGFDFARTAWFEQLGAVGYAMKAPVIEGREATPGWRATIEHRIDALRSAIGSRIKAALPGEAGAIATALVTGERGGISEETNQAFKDSGLFHILSISGLHMVVMAGAIFYLVRLMLAVIPGMALVMPIKKIASVAGIIAAIVYSAISGGAFATVRAALMISVMFVAVLFDRPALALRNVALAAIMILALYPESLFDAGFQMSFAAVTGLIAAYEELRRRRGIRDAPQVLLRISRFFGGIVASTLIAGIAVAPFAAYHFHQSQQYAVLANLIAIPICNIIVMPMALLALLLMPFSLESLALWPLGKAIDVMSWCAEAVGSLPGAVGHVAQMPWLAFALMVGGGLWLALWQTRWRILGLASVFAGVGVAPTLPQPDVLIGRNGDLVAVRLPDGQLSALPARQSKFEMERWLLASGDGRTPAEAQRGAGFRCDASGCTVDVKGVLIAVPRHPSAFVDDCANARIVIADVPRPKFCEGPELIVDLFDMWGAGGYALYIDDATISTAQSTSNVSLQPVSRPAPELPHRPSSSPSFRRASSGWPRPIIRVETVASQRGTRPWAMPRAADIPTRPSPRTEATPPIALPPDLPQSDPWSNRSSDSDAADDDVSATDQ